MFHLNYNDSGQNYITSANGSNTVFRGSSNNVTGMVIQGSGPVDIYSTLRHLGDTDTLIEFATDTITFDTAGGERVRINSAGEVYIGSATSNGQGKLFVNDSSGATTTQAHIRNANSTGTAKVFLNLDDAKYASVGLENGSLVFRNSTSSTPAEKFRIDSNGNVSVGNNPTVSSDTLFHVEKSGETNVQFEGDTSTLGARLTLKNNNTGAGAKNQIDFADAGGQSTSSIQGFNTDQTNNYGYLTFNTRSAQGTPPEERMRISKEGYVTKPDQPRALVKISSTTTMSNGKVTNWASPTYNVGSLWDTSNYRFVAPVTGLYLVGGNFRIGAPGKVRVTRFEIRAYNTSNVQMAGYGGGVGGGNNYDGGSSGYDHPYVGFTNAIYLQTGQYLELWLGEVGTEYTTYIQVSNEQSHMWCVLLQ